MKEQNYLDHLVGVFGQPVAENPGVIIQDAAFQAMGLEKWHFLTIDVDKERLGDAIKAIRAFKMHGINLTIPHKIEAIKYVDKISEAASLIGAINIIVNRNGFLIADNTDGKGFMLSLAENNVSVEGKKAVVFGAGGAARAICVEMGLAGVREIHIVNRLEDRRLGDALVEILQKNTEAAVLYTDWEGAYAIPTDTDIVVNATSVGLYPHIEDLPNVRYETLRDSMFVQDVIPNPIESAFIRKVKGMGIPCATGAGMLINQAALNIEMWTGKKPDKKVMMNALMKAMA